MIVCPSMFAGLSPGLLYSESEGFQAVSASAPREYTFHHPSCGLDGRAISLGIWREGDVGISTREFERPLRSSSDSIANFDCGLLRRDGMGQDGHPTSRLTVLLCRCGEIGRHSRLKICCLVRGVWVQVPPAAFAAFTIWDSSSLPAADTHGPRLRNPRRDEIPAFTPTFEPGSDTSDFWLRFKKP